MHDLFTTEVICYICVYVRDESREHCTRGEYGAYAHRRGGPLSLRPLSPNTYNAAVPKGPAFSFLNY